MQEQKSKQKSNNLLSKRADTDSGSREMQITRINWGFRPRIKHRTSDGQIKVTVPSLDTIARVLRNNTDLNNAAKSVDTETHPTVESLSDTNLQAQTYRSLLLYGTSDEYLSITSPDDTEESEVAFQPFMFVELESDTGDTVYTSFSDPFRTTEVNDLLSAAENQEYAELKYDDEKPVLSVHNSTYYLSQAVSSNGGTFLEERFFDLPVKSKESFLSSEYDGWAKIPVSDVYNEDGKTVVESADEQDLDWVFDEPIVWDENEEKSVELIENFASGDSSQLESVYIRPCNPKDDKNSIDTKQHQNYNWEIALENPGNRTNQQNEATMVTALLTAVMTMLAVGLITMVFAALLLL